MQLTQGEIRDKEIPFRLADNSKRSELQMTKISRAASIKSLSVILEVKSGIKKCHSDLQITTQLPLTSWARIPFASAIRHKQIGFIFTANKKSPPGHLSLLLMDQASWKVTKWATWLFSCRSLI